MILLQFAYSIINELPSILCALLVATHSALSPTLSSSLSESSSLILSLCSASRASDVLV
jgi:hypothetical protein